MQLIRWRKQNGLSVRRAAELCGGVSPASISKIERGQIWPSADTIDRIYYLTRAIGPEPVGAQDHYEAWRKLNSAISAQIRVEAAQSARAHRRLAGNPKRRRAAVRDESPGSPIPAGRVNGGQNG
jgi:transcriptional regulator with XRE-family HTH domain